MGVAGWLFISQRHDRNVVAVDADRRQRRVGLAALLALPGGREAIFTPFFRSETADTFSGYGLGLAIARSVALAHGGGIHAASRSEGGLAVTLVLPNARSV